MKYDEKKIRLFTPVIWDRDGRQFALDEIRCSLVEIRKVFDKFKKPHHTTAYKKFRKQLAKER